MSRLLTILLLLAIVCSTVALPATAIADLVDGMLPHSIDSVDFLSGDEGVLPNKFIGAATYSVAIDIPEGRNGMQPDLNLQYKSLFRESWVGFGWQLEFGAIERNTKFGVNYGGDDFVYRTSEGAHELVKVAADEFRLKVEGRFLRFERLTGFDGRPMWIMTNKAGVRYVFGLDVTTRQENPDDSGQIFRWCLERVEDPNGNYMTASYFKDIEDNQIYLEKIEYTGHELRSPIHSVNFILEEDSAAIEIYRLGFRQKTKYRLSAIEVESNSTLVKRYALAYAGSTSSSRTRLESIAIIGKDGSSVLRTIEFDFTETTNQLIDKGIQATNNYGGSPVVGDIDGDGRHDILFGPLSNGAWQINRSSGTSYGSQTVNPGAYGYYFDKPGSVTMQDVTGDGSEEIVIGPSMVYPCVIDDDFGDCVYTAITGQVVPDMSADPVSGGQFYVLDYENGTLVNKGAWNAEIPGWSSLYGQTRFADVNGDGRKDLIAGPNIAGDWRLYLSDGTQFVDQGIVLHGVYNSFSGNRVHVMDVTGDRGQELVFGPDDLGNIYVVEFSPQGLIDHGLWYTGVIGANIRPEAVRSMDLNGDKLEDLLITTDALGNWHALISTGHSFVYKGQWATGKYESFYNQSHQLIRSLDFNGDGLLDILLGPFFNGGHASYAYYMENTGSSLIDRGQVFYLDTSDNNPAFPLDMDADGRQGFGIVDGTYVFIHEPANAKPDLLKEVRNGIGGTTQLSYVPSASFPNARLPFPIPVVSQITRNDGNGNVSTTSYGYSGGYYHHVEKDFRGFSYVKETGPAGTDGEKKQVETYYHQGNGVAPAADDPSVTVGYTKGKTYLKQVRDGGSQLYSQSKITYAAPDPATEPYYFAPQQQVEVTRCDSTGSCGVRQKTVLAFDAYGNLTRKEEHGDPSDPLDDRTTITEYSANTYDWLVGLPFRETLYEGIGTSNQVAQTSYDYDSGSSDCSSSGSNSTPTKGNVSRITRWLDTGDDPQELFGYDNFGNQVCSKDARGNISTIRYDDDTDTYPRVATNAKGQQVASEYYGVDGQLPDKGLYGQLKSITDPNGAQKITEYDVFGRKVREQLSDGSAATWAYNNFGTVGVQHARLDNSLGLWYEIYFDGQGRPIKTRQPGPAQIAGTEVIATSKQYDLRGLLKQESLPYFEGGPILYRNNSFDPLGRVVRVDKPDGSSEQSCYGFDGSQVRIDANLHKKRQVLDSLGRLVRVDEYEGEFASCNTAAGTPYATTNYQYDSLDNLTRVTNATGNETLVTYDSLGRKITMRDPDMGNWSYGFDAAGNLAYQRDGKGQMIVFEYDALNRLQVKSYASAGLVAADQADGVEGEHTFGYLDGNDLFLPMVLTEKVDSDGLELTNRVSFSYDDPTRSNAIGRISTMVDDSGITDYYYLDPLARSSRVDRTIDGQTYGITTAVDAMLRTTAITYPDGAVVPYLYDNGGNLWHVGEYAEFSEYNAFGRAGKVTYQNGVTADYAYIAENGRLQTSQVGTASASYISRQYDYFANGNVKDITDLLSAERTQSFGYDSLDRLKTAESLIYGALTYDYDQLGNLTHKEGIDFFTDTNDKPHQLVSSSNGRWYDYDANGNMLSDGVRTFEYDIENRPVSISYNGGISEFVYDGMGNRVKKSGPQGDRLYIGKLYEKTASGGAKFIFAGQQRIALVSDLDTHYYHQDHLGGTSVVTDGNGNKVEQLFYKPFGDLVEDSGSISVTHRYTGQELDAETDLYFYNARYYNPAIGRFVSADSLVPHPFNPQSLNRYSYVLNNPVKLVDPTGHAPGEADVAGLAAAEAKSNSGWGNGAADLSEDFNAINDEISSFAELDSSFQSTNTDADWSAINDEIQDYVNSLGDLGFWGQLKSKLTQTRKDIALLGIGIMVFGRDVMRQGVNIVATNPTPQGKVGGGVVMATGAAIVGTGWAVVQVSSED